jgi:hypothetical protein
MNAIRSVFNALSNLAASINAIAGVLDVAAGKLRQQLALDEAHVIEHQPAVLEDGTPTAKRNGRKTAASV